MDTKGLMFPAVIDGELGAYGVVIPDMPGVCCAIGNTVDEALAHAEEALIDLLTMLEEDGEDLPQPSAPEDLELATGEMVAYVKVVRKPLVSVKTAAAELGVSVGRVRQLCLSDLIVGAERMGRDWMIPSPVVRKVLARGRRPSVGGEKGRQDC